MRELIAEEFLYVLAPLLISTAAMIYYKERGVVHLNPYSTLWPRLIAPCIDAVVLWPVVRLLPLFLIYFFELSGEMSATLLVAFNMIIPFYLVILHGLFGATVGKFVTKILLAGAKTKNRSNFREAFIRDLVPIGFSLVWIVWTVALKGEQGFLKSVSDYMIPIIFGTWYLVEFFTMFFNAKMRSVPDLLAGTVVIRYDWN